MKVEGGWKVAPGAHIRKAHVPIIVSSIEECRKRLNLKHGAIPPRAYEKFCADPKQPVHPIWKAKCEELKGEVGLQAARYLLRSVVEVVVEHGKPIVRRPVMIFNDPKPPLETAGISYPIDEIRKSPDLMMMAENEFRDSFREACRKFLTVAQLSRLKKVVAAVLAEL